MKKHILLLLIVTTIIFSVSSQAFATAIAEIEGNDTYLTAQDINSSFSTIPNSNVFDTFGLLPTVSISGSNGATSDVDYYSFTVASAGMIGYFDIDDITITNNVVDLEATLSLFDSGYNLLAADFDTVNFPEDPGSFPNIFGDSFGAFLGVYKFINPGTYFIAVSNFGNIPGSLGTPGAYLARPDCLPANFCNPNSPASDEYNGGQLYSNSGPTSVITTGGYYSSGNYTLHVTVGTPVPEPSTALLFGLGIITLLIISRTYLLPVSNKK